jgi:hypothetical protein
MKIGQDSVKDRKNASPKSKTDRTEEEKSELSAFLVLRKPTVFKRQETGF